MTRVLSRTLAVSALTLAAALTSTARAEQSPVGAEPHLHHAVAEARRAVAHYVVPDVQLIRDDGAVVKLPSEMNDGRPVVLAFIYTSCTSVCPLISHTLADVQHRLGERSSGVHLMSISIDPEQDTPSRLRDYAHSINAGPEWQHYTGTLEASQTAQRAFNVYRGDKMSHSPAVLVRSSADAQWVRLDGFTTAEQVLAELPDAGLAR